jgi:hypothetical protein
MHLLKAPAMFKNTSFKGPQCEVYRRILSGYITHLTPFVPTVSILLFLFSRFNTIRLTHLSHNY